MKIKIKPEWQEITQNFAVNRYEAKKHVFAKRNQRDPATIMSQINQGTISEFAVAEAFNRFGIEATQPDTTIHTQAQSSFAADLTKINSGAQIHVKNQTQESATAHGLSWVFQKEDIKLRLTPTDKDFIVFTLMPGDGTVEIVGVVKAKAVPIHLYKDMQVPDVSGIKKALYWDDIQHLCGSLDDMFLYDIKK